MKNKSSLYSTNFEPFPLSLIGKHSGNEKLTFNVTGIVPKKYPKLMQRL